MPGAHSEAEKFGQRAFSSLRQVSIISLNDMADESIKPIPDSLEMPELSSRIDEICDKFETEWMSGKSPRIEAFLADWTEDPARLLAELLPVEIELRRRSGAPISLQDYLQQFPKHAELIREIVKRDSLGGAMREGERQMPNELGHYRLMEELGSGGMGTVYKALHTQLDKIVAIKVLSGAHISNPHAIARFQREMKAVGKLSHSNIIGAHDAGEIRGTYYLVMEYVDGVDLSKVLQRAGRLSTSDACEVVRQAAVGLQHAHLNGWVHRDIKPSNLMLTTDGQIKILDLGLARLHLLSPGEQELTSTGQLMGTLDYMAPEQCNDSSAVDIRADVYSLGATLYKLVTGVAPLGSGKYDTPLKKLAALAKVSHQPLRKCLIHVPKALSALVDRMLAKDPTKRPATPGKVAEELAAFTSGSNLIALASRARYASEGIGLLDNGTSNTEAYLSASLTDTRPSLDASTKRPAAEASASLKKVASSKRHSPLMVLLACGIVGMAGITTWFAKWDNPGDLPIVASQEDGNHTLVANSAKKVVQSLRGAGPALATLVNMTGESPISKLSAPWQNFVASIGAMDQPLQVALVIDGTDSMSEDLRSISDSLPTIAERLSRYKSNPSLISFSVVIFRDTNAPSGKLEFPLGKSFTSDIEFLSKALAKMDVETGAPWFEEPVDLAMHEAMSQLEWSSSANTLRWLVVFSDASPYQEGYSDERGGQRTFSDQELLKAAKKAPAIVHTVLCSSGYIIDDAVQDKNANDKASGKNVSLNSTADLQKRQAKLRKSYELSLTETRRFMGKMASSTGGFFLDLSEDFQKSFGTESERRGDFNSSGSSTSVISTTGPPRFILSTKVPISTVRAIKFTPDSERLLAGGGDKFVNSWSLHRNAQEVRLRIDPNPPIYWEISRGNRGAIYALAVSPDGNKAAVGGVSAREGNGDIWIFHPGMGELTTVLRGHKQSICGLDFSPDGKYLASSSVDGDTRLWNANDDWSSTSLLPETNHFADRPVKFLSNTQLAMACSVNTDFSNWQIAVASVTGEATRKLSQSHVGQIMSIERDVNSDGWASADRSGNVFLWKGTANESPRILREGRNAAALAFAAGNRLFISTMRDPHGLAVLELWDTSTQQRLDEILVSEGEDSFACEVSPNGKYLATYASDTSDLLVWDLTDNEGAALSKPLSAGDVTRVRGSGCKTWHVAFDKANTYKLGIGQTLTHVSAWDAPRSKLSVAFDLRSRVPLALADHETGWRATDEGAGNSQLQLLDNGYQLQMSVGGAEGTIRLDRTFQGPARSYCWLIDPNGKPYAVAIGTDKHYGIFVYGLPHEGKCDLLRYFRNHYGWVTSVSVSTDGKYLASSAVDGTINIWSLDDLREGGVGFSQRRAWGGTLVSQGENRLVVKDLNDAGILATRGLQVGDEIVGVQYINDNQVARATSARDMLAALERNPLWNTVVVSVLRPGKGATQRELFVPAWDPLVSLYLDQQGEWAAWTPQGYFDSSVAGDNRFGWILNAAEVGRRPRFMRADRLRGELKRPDILDHLLKAGNLPDALKMAGLPAGPARAQEQVSLLASRLPDVTIIRPLHDESFKLGEKIVAKARIEFPDAAKIDNFRLSMYVNNIPYGEGKQRVEGRVAYCEWEAAPRNKYNTIRVTAEQVSGDEPLDTYSEDQVSVQVEIEPK